MNIREIVRVVGLAVVVIEDRTERGAAKIECGNIHVLFVQPKTLVADGKGRMSASCDKIWDDESSVVL
jgi:hypothetical protein